MTNLSGCSPHYRDTHHIREQQPLNETGEASVVVDNTEEGSTGLNGCISCVKNTGERLGNALINTGQWMLDNPIYGLSVAAAAMTGVALFAGGVAVAAGRHSVLGGDAQCARALDCLTSPQFSLARGAGYTVVNGTDGSAISQLQNVTMNSTVKLNLTSACDTPSEHQMIFHCQGSTSTYIPFTNTTELQSKLSETACASEKVTNPQLDYSCDTASSNCTDVHLHENYCNGMVLKFKTTNRKNQVKIKNAQEQVILQTPEHTGKDSKIYRVEFTTHCKKLTPSDLNTQFTLECKGGESNRPVNTPFTLKEVKDKKMPDLAKCKADDTATPAQTCSPNFASTSTSTMDQCTSTA